MKKVYEAFDRDIKRVFNDVTTVDRDITALDIDEYVITHNVEDILGSFVAYFFDDLEMFPNLKMKCEFLQDKYRDKIGPGVWIRGFFGAGKSHLLKVIHTLFTEESLEYKDETGKMEKLNVVKEIQEKVISSDIAELIGNINPSDYLTFIFSANHITKTGDTIVDCLPKEISRQLDIDFDEDKEYSAMDVAEFLKETLKSSGKKRMLIFVDEILDVLDTGEKVRKFEGLIELLNNDIWFVVTSLEAKTKLLSTVTAERMIHRFGQEQILYPEEMVWIVKRRYLAKTDEAAKEIEKSINIAKLQYLFSGAYLSDTEDGKIEAPNIVSSYPFYPFQLAYMKELLKNESKGSARNMMKTIKSIVKNPEVYDKELGYFVDIELIYEELKSKRSIEEEYSDLINGLEGAPITDGNNKIVDKAPLLKTLKAIVLLSQVKPEGVKTSMILPFVYNEDIINNENKLLDYLEILTNENFINNEGGIYKPITKKESDVWTRIKSISSITESSIRDRINGKIYKIFGATFNAGKYPIKSKINDFSKDIAFVLKTSDISNELPNIYSCIPFENDIEKLKNQAFEASNNKEKLFIIPDKKYDGNSLYKATKFYLQMNEALKREADFGIDQKLRIQIETKQDTAVDGDIDKMIEECFKYSVISYNGQENKDFSTPALQRMTAECEKMLKKKYTMFFGKMLREQVDTFISKEILSPTLKMNAAYLKNLDLIDSNGAVNTGNRYYNEFLKSFPDGGFEKDGASVVDEFSKGKYGWELDVIKILTALAVKNSDLKIAREGRAFSIPEDNQELTSKNGPFAPRKRDIFDSCKFTKINISDEEIRKAIITIKSIDSNMVVAIKLKDVAEKIKMLTRKTVNVDIDIYSEIISETVKDEISVVSVISNDIEKRTDSEDIILTFNKKICDSEIVYKFKKVLYISDNKDKISVICSIFSLLKNSGNLEDGRVKEISEKFISGEIKCYDELLKKYKIAFNEKYKEYEKIYNSIVADVKSLPEWNKITQEQQSKVINLIKFVKLNDFAFEGLKVRNIGTLDDLKMLMNELTHTKTTASKQVHLFNDQNELEKQVKEKPKVPQDKQKEVSQSTPHVNNRVSKKFKSYSNGKIINIDSMEKLEELDIVFNDIKNKIKQDLESGKKITLEL
ncbi:hypothetical protein [Clostridium sp. JS66]|uniref:hypothetical protein n=1 Tax=Clostridium sp. JS66 TaxID=3064705 RepID=UPI00298EAEBB|nr:hypothetical protein [Clostridium sp. JS66]WPC40064.1 hypothetical protein Q6H37_19440 [Clostridium sp. JS66]